MKLVRLFVLFAAVVCLLAACEGDPAPSASNNSDSGGSQADGANGTDTATHDTGARADSGATTSGDAHFEATGKHNGNSFAMKCMYKDNNLRTTGTTVQCQKIQWFATCRPDPAKVGDIDLFQVWFNLPTANGAAGTHTFKAGGGISIGNAMGAPLNSLSKNLTKNEIVVKVGGPAKSDISGTFSASWADNGGEHGEVAGSFSLPCTKK